MKSKRLSPDKNYLLFDDDCGVCTTFSKFIGRLLSIPIIPMHTPEIEKEGYSKIGKTRYWKSFHVVKNGVWTTEGDAITALASLFPFGSILKSITKIPPISVFLKLILRMMQNRRKFECRADYS